jgi:hypothetical protein
MNIERLSWRMVRFTGWKGGPAYVDLAEVSGIVEVKPKAGDAWELDVVVGAQICMKGGQIIVVRDTADAVFGEVHRFRTEQEPPAPEHKLPGAAP